MRLTFTVDIPLKEPEKLIDLNKLSETENVSYVLLNQEGIPDYTFNNLTYQSLKDHSKNISIQLLTKKPEIESLISEIKAQHNSAMRIEHKFPDGFGLRYPNHMAEYNHSQARYNSLHNETFVMIDAIVDYLEHVTNLCALMQGLLDNGLVDIKNKDTEIEQLKAQIATINAEFKERESKLVETQTAVLTDIRARMAELSRICDEKDVVIDQSNQNYTILLEERDGLKVKLSESQNLIVNKFKNTEELSQYINTMLKDKRELTVILEAQSKEIAELKYKIETKEAEFQLALEKNRERFQGDLERDRRKYEAEIFKLKDLAMQRQAAGTS